MHAEQRDERGGPGDKNGQENKGGNGGEDEKKKRWKVFLLCGDPKLQTSDPLLK